jgi:spore coat protein A, manganese oxidase
VPLLIRDALFARSGALLFDDGNTDSLFGDVVLVNGRPWPRMAVERRKYRFRVLNGSASRSFELQLSSKDTMTVISSDSGLMAAPQPTDRLLIGMAERYGVVIDFARYKVGDTIELRNLTPKNTADIPTTRRIMRFDVVSDASDPRNNEVPPVLDPDNEVMALQERQATKRRSFRFERRHGLWTINGKVWNRRRIDANPAFGAVEIWELENKSGGWFHPIHLHLVDFKILDRNGRPPRSHELAPKDTVYVGEGDLVRVIMRFEHQRGRYLMHCHNTVHEDHDMMTQFEVGTGGPDPVTTAPATTLPGRR